MGGGGGGGVGVRAPGPVSGARVVQIGDGDVQQVSLRTDIVTRELQHNAAAYVCAHIIVNSITHYST